MSSREDRKTPLRFINEYVMTYEHGSNIAMANVNANVKKLDNFASDGFEIVSDIQQLSFSFPFQDKKYTEIIVGQHGYIVLLDANRTAAFNITHVFYDDVLQSETPPNSDKNGLVRTNGFLSGSHVLIAPWMAYQRKVPEDTDGIASSAHADYLEIGLVGSNTPHVNNIYYNALHNQITFAADTNVNGMQAAVVTWYSIDGLSRLITYEAVLYANGKIEFNYLKSNNSRTQSTQAEEFDLANFNRTDAAVVGVFANGNNAFRDFSSDIYRQGIYTVAPIENELGGFSYETSLNYQDDAVTPYRIVPNSRFWPVGVNGNGRFSFFPLTRQRKILPRNLQVNLDAQQHHEAFFNDKKTQIFTSSISNNISYPTKQSRKTFDTIPGFALSQDLFTNQITSSGRSTVEHTDFFIEPYQAKKPFNDKTVPNDLKSYEKIELDFFINKPVRMLASTASIYYFNKSFGSWLMPQNCLTQIEPYNPNSTYAPPFFENNELYLNPNFYLKNKLITEDAKGFNAIGMLVSSGSNVVTGGVGFVWKTGVQTNDYINSFPTEQNRSKAQESFYEKTILNNENYSPVEDEIIRLTNLKGPFLLEKAVIEVPFELGDGWFKDVTAPFRTFDSASKDFDTNRSDINDERFDIGGPAITVALYNKLSRDQENSLQKIDLILSSTLTHTFDNQKYLEVSSSTQKGAFYGHNGYIRHLGFKSFHATPGAVVIPNASSSLTGYSFTGSVNFNCTAAIQNGVLVANYDSHVDALGFGTEYPELTIQKLLQDKIVIRKLDTFYGPFYVEKQRIMAIQPYGRAATGFSPSGRSKGNEHKSVNISNIDNPLKYDQAVSINQLPASWQSLGTTSNPAGVKSYSCVYPLTSSADSPYVLLPGDELFVSISKTRPCVYSTLGVASSSNSTCQSFFSSSLAGHDVVLATGSFKITLYGSYIQNETKIPAVLSEEINGKSIYTNIGDDLILDQYEGVYRDQFFRTYSDAIITGSLVEIYNGRLYLSNRGRWKDASTTMPIRPIDMGDPLEILPNDIFLASISSFYTKLSDKYNGIQINAKHKSDLEVYYDSCVPNIEQVWKVNNAKPWAYSGDAYNARISLNQPSPYPTDGIFKNAATDNFWCASFPFEPRYKDVERNINILTSYKIQNNENSGTPDRVSGLFIDLGIWNASLTSAPTYYEYLNSFEFYPPTSPVQTKKLRETVTTQLNKVLYGFGDFNTISYSGSIRNGYGYFADFYYRDDTTLYAPIIRGTKYGITNVVPTNTTAIFRRNRFGQFRDMLEQRPFTKFISPEAINNKFQKLSSPISVKFIDNATGVITAPENTDTSNMHFEASSSLPYFDGLIKNR